MKASLVSFVVARLHFVSFCFELCVFCCFFSCSNFVLLLLFFVKPSDFCFSLWISYIVDCLFVEIDSCKTSAFTASFTHITKVFAANLTSLGNFYFFNQWAMQ